MLTKQIPIQAATHSSYRDSNRLIPLFNPTPTLMQPESYPHTLIQPDSYPDSSRLLPRFKVHCHGAPPQPKCPNAPLGPDYEVPGPSSSMTEDEVYSYASMVAIFRLPFLFGWRPPYHKKIGTETFWNKNEEYTMMPLICLVAGNSHFVSRWW